MKIKKYDKYDNIARCYKAPQKICLKKKMIIKSE